MLSVIAGGERDQVNRKLPQVLLLAVLSLVDRLYERLDNGGYGESRRDTLDREREKLAFQNLCFFYREFLIFTRNNCCRE